MYLSMLNNATQSRAVGSMNQNQSGGSAKPTYNSNQVFTYLEDANEAGLAYGNRVTKYYKEITAQDGAMSVDELKKQIGEMFSEYTLTDREPKNVVNGKHYLYIDESQLKKMASDPEYRAKVYGLMDREYTCGDTVKLKYSDGKVVTSHVTGSIFSLSENNRKYDCGDGVPYLGSCTMDHPVSSSDSHPQVRSISYLSDNLDPAKSAAKARKTAAARDAARREARRLHAKDVAKKEAKKFDAKA